MPSPRAPHPAFSAAWAQAWGDELNANPAYQEAGAAWRGDLVLEMAASNGTPARAVYLDLDQGVCRAARQATPDDLVEARYRFEGSHQAWRRLLGGALSPAVAIMTGQLKLTRGSLLDFLPYAGAVTALLGAGVAIAASFPED
jgi:putative sterol carrier protein